MGKDDELQGVTIADGRWTFEVRGLSCATCVRAVETALRRVDGVRFASVNLATEKAFVLTEPGVEADDLFRAVRGAGYEPRPEVPEPDAEEKRFRRARGEALGALALAIPVTAVMAVHLLGLLHHPALGWVEDALSTLLILGFGGRTALSAWRAVSHRHANMDVLITLAVGAALGTVPLARLLPGVVSFGGLGAMILALHLGGRYLEARLKWRAGRSLRNLLEGQNPDCQILLDDGSLQTFPAAEVKPGVRLLLRAGEKVGADGVLESGELLIDESMVSGEPVPVARRTGDAVIGGTVVVQGSGVLSVTHAAADSFLSRMLRLVEQAQSIKVPLQALADRITNVFVPVVFAAALGAGLFWWLAAGWNTALTVFLASLVIACPCALGLATPMALMAATAEASRRGILFRTGEALQVPRKVTAMVLDKTGTLTQGRPRVVEHTVPREWWPLVAGLEAHSLHPLAKAVLDAAAAQGVEPEPGLEQVKEIGGQGLRCVHRGREVFLGRPWEESRYEDWHRQGRTVIELRVGDAVIGAMALEDPLKEDAAEAVRRLSGRGIRVVLATGDHEIAARLVAERLGITEVHSRVRPEDKFELVQTLIRQGHTVAMVGDGINDAAALKAADVGVAMGSAAALSAESADVVLVHDRLGRLTDLIDLSGAAYRQIRFNLFWAFAYNTAALPLALAGLIHPLAAEAAMLASSLSVVLGSLLLSWSLSRRREHA